MGNGALPNGPSYRAHPRLYRLGPAATLAKCSLIGGKRTLGRRSTSPIFEYRAELPKMIAPATARSSSAKLPTGPPVDPRSRIESPVILRRSAPGAEPPRTARGTLPESLCADHHRDNPRDPATAHARAVVGS